MGNFSHPSNIKKLNNKRQNILTSVLFFHKTTEFYTPFIRAKPLFTIH